MFVEKVLEIGQAYERRRLRDAVPGSDRKVEDVEKRIKAESEKKDGRWQDKDIIAREISDFLQVHSCPLRPAGNIMGAMLRLGLPSGILGPYLQITLPTEQ